MDFAEIPRSMPQFGKSMRNLLRSREEVFHPRMVASRRGRGTRCCGEAGADSVGRGACGCGGREGPTRGIVNESISDGPWSGGNDLPWIESDGIIIDVGRPLVLVQAGSAALPSIAISLKTRLRRANLRSSLILTIGMLCIATFRASTVRVRSSG